jgi:plastocyanin
MILPLLLVFLITAGLSLGQSAKNASIVENNSTASVNIVSPENGTIKTGESEPANDTHLENATQPGNVTRDENETIAAKATGLKFIWSVTGIEADQIIMVLDQDGTDLFGQAKYEPQSGSPWNAEVTGSVSGDKVDLTITAQKDKELVSSKLSGTLDNKNGTINGNYTQVSLGKIVNKGSFTATEISPDTSSYTQATIEAPVPAAQQTASTTPAAAIPNSIEITDTSFQPNPMTIQVGTTVTWVNRDSKDQEVVSSNGAFDSGNIAPGGQYQYTFSQAGTFDYSSKTTSAITGKVIVTDNSKSRFVDVHEYADKQGVGGDLSGVPPGMGGSGGL